MQYPMLDYDGMSADPQGGQAMGIPDNWNAPVAGERIAICLTPAEFPNRARVSGQTYYEGWVWEKSTNGVVWGPVHESSGNTVSPPPPTYEISPTAADVGSFIRARMKLSDGSTAYTRTLGGLAVASSGATAGDEVSFRYGHEAPRVGAQIAANDPVPAGAVDSRFGWQRCPNNTAPHSDCTAIISVPGHWWIYYTPTTEDIGSYLRMYVYYETSGGTWTRRTSPLTTGVVARP